MLDGFPNYRDFKFLICICIPVTTRACVTKMISPW
uniref:Uncharacterized protein n=1 Tax=Arundo donax TaxID=35708 RepID=A0A0A9CGI5_ARUDO